VARHEPRLQGVEHEAQRRKGQVKIWQDGAIRSAQLGRMRGNLSKSGKRLRVAGNPEQLTNRQHVFPTASIRRFADSSGLVSMAHCATKKQFKVKPEDDIFCAFCVWDYRAESGYMVHIENQFQALADEILKNRIVSLNADQAQVVTRFWALWSLRAELRDAPEPDRSSRGIAGELLTNEQRDRIESLGVTFILSSGDKMPGRFIAGLRIQKGIDERSYQLQGRRWGIVRAQVGEFLVPDSPANMIAVPLTPEIGLYFEHDNCLIPESEVAKANLLARKLARHYYFARDLSACPGITE
jgi:hypothetical protein